MGRMRLSCLYFHLNTGGKSFSDIDVCRGFSDQIGKTGAKRPFPMIVDAARSVYIELLLVQRGVALHDNGLLRQFFQFIEPAAIVGL